MSKKKPEKSRKRSKALLKGVVTAGAVIGGVDIFSDANVVYAAELDETGIATNDEVVVETEMSLAQEAAEALETEESTTAAETESTNNVEEVQEQENNEVEDTTTPTEEEILLITS